MSNNNIYPIQLLNDIHNWFPDILYNPGRFRTVQDLLEYIRQAADVNPYSRGLQLYRARQPTTRTTTATTTAATGGAGAAPVPTTTPQINSHRTQFDNFGIPVTTRVRTVPVQNTNNIISSLFGLFADDGTNNMINQMFTPDILQSFLNQTVQVSPTADEIAMATTVYTVNNRQTDICTICQDHIEERQQVRRIGHCGHYFHKDCIDPWFQRNVHCPTCRHDIREVENPNSPPAVPANHRRTNVRQPDNN